MTNRRPGRPELAHIVAALRDYIATEGISPSELQQRLGLHRKSTTAYGWLAGANCPTAPFRAALSKLLGQPVAFFTPRHTAAETALGPARTALVLAAQHQPPPPPGPAQGGRLAYEGHGDGTATVTVRARLPIEQAKPLFRLLLDAGIDAEPPQLAEPPP
jgi:hypothetical protein